MPEEPTNRDDSSRAGIVRTLAQLLSRLDPAFLGLLVVDAVFMVSIVYLFHAQNLSRERVLGPVMQACIEAVPQDAIKLLVHPENTAALQAAIDNVSRSMGDNRDTVRDLGRQIEALRPAIEALRTDLTRDTRARLTGPQR